MNLNQVKIITRGRFMPVLLYAGALFCAGVIAGCGLAERDNKNDPESSDYSVGAAPIIANGSTITAHEILVVQFTDVMDTASVTWSGDMGAVVTSARVAWSKTEYDNDTATVTPDISVADSSTLWPSGDNKTLVVTGKTKQGESVTKTFTYNVFRGVCVDDSGSSTSRGTVLQPMATVQQGMAKVQAIYSSGIRQLRVAAGTYNVDALAAPITMVEGLSMYGGYADSFQSRDSASIVSEIKDTSTTGGASGDPKAVIMSGSGITNATVIDGFTITGGTGTYTTAISCNGSSPVIKNCIINCGSDGSGEIRYAIFIYSSSPDIFNNSINNSSNSGGGNISYCYGIYNNLSSPNIQGNIINAGKAGNGGSQESCAIRSLGTSSNPLIDKNVIYAGQGYNTYGIYIRDSTSVLKIINNLIKGGKTNISGNNYTLYINGNSPFLLNNTIISGIADSYSAYSYSIYLTGSTTSTIVENNIFSFVTGTNSYNSYAVYEAGASSDVATFKNNCFNNYPDGSLYNIKYCNFSATNLTTITDVESTLNGESSGCANGNIYTDPGFSSDYHLSSSTPSSVYEGGMDLSTTYSFTTDRDGATRTGNGITGWSIGCYEFNK